MSIEIPVWLLWVLGIVGGGIVLFLAVLGILFLIFMANFQVFK